MFLFPSLTSSIDYGEDKRPPRLICLYCISNDKDENNVLTFSRRVGFGDVLILQYNEWYPYFQTINSLSPNIFVFPGIVLVCLPHY
jgi:hypothetical protein